MNFIFFASLKNLKKHEFHFLQAKKTQKTLLPRPGSRAKKEANLIICTNAREKILRKGWIKLGRAFGKLRWNFTQMIRKIHNNIEIPKSKRNKSWKLKKDIPPNLNTEIYFWKSIYFWNVVSSVKWQKCVFYYTSRGGSSFDLKRHFVFSALFKIGSHSFAFSFVRGITVNLKKPL